MSSRNSGKSIYNKKRGATYLDLSRTRFQQEVVQEGMTFKHSVLKQPWKNFGYQVMEAEFTPLRIPQYSLPNMPVINQGFTADVLSPATGGAGVKGGTIPPLGVGITDCCRGDFLSMGICGGVIEGGGCNGVKETLFKSGGQHNFVPDSTGNCDKATSGQNPICLWAGSGTTPFRWELHKGYGQLMRAGSSGCAAKSSSKTPRLDCAEEAYYVPSCRDFGDSVIIIVNDFNARCSGSFTLDFSACPGCGAFSISGSDTITKSSTAQYTAAGCCSSESWSISGTGATITNAGLVTTDGTACGTLTVTASCPSCGTSATKEIRVSDGGSWSTIASCNHTSDRASACGNSFPACDICSTNCPDTFCCVDTVTSGKYKTTTRFYSVDTTSSCSGVNFNCCTPYSSCSPSTADCFGTHAGLQCLYSIKEEWVC